MPAYLRIARHKNLESLSEDSAKATNFEKYQEALAKLIPAEVVALYLGGKNAIQTYFHDGATTSDAGSEPGFWIGWLVISFLGLVAYRRWATSDKSHGVPPEWPAVAISAVSFLVWVYSFGDAFRIVNVWHPLVATLLVLAWTFAAPLVYRLISPKP